MVKDGGVEGGQGERGAEAPAGLVQQRLEQDKFQKSGNIPQFLQFQRFMRLHSFHKSAEARRREVSIDGTEIKRGDGGGARFVSLRGKNDSRKPGYNTRLIGESIHGRSHRASIGAEFKKC